MSERDAALTNIVAKALRGTVPRATLRELRAIAEQIVDAVEREWTPPSQAHLDAGERHPDIARDTLARYLSATPPDGWHEIDNLTPDEARHVAMLAIERLRKHDGVWMSYKRRDALVAFVDELTGLLRGTIDWSDEHRHKANPVVPDHCQECEDEWPCAYARAFIALRRLEAAT